MMGSLPDATDVACICPTAAAASEKWPVYADMDYSSAVPYLLTRTSPTALHALSLGFPCPTSVTSLSLDWELSDSSWRVARFRSNEGGIDGAAGSVPCSRYLLAGTCFLGP